MFEWHEKSHENLLQKDSNPLVFEFYFNKRSRLYQGSMLRRNINKVVWFISNAGNHSANEMKRTKRSNFWSLLVTSPSNLFMSALFDIEISLASSSSSIGLENLISSLNKSAPEVEFVKSSRRVGRAPVLLGAVIDFLLQDWCKLNENVF